ncbi:hypothetical protein [Mycobacterium simiae]|uniref:hypothetical protein n=1 Tax=Mycobacterium simiae TaxID=1784 RepID=UPI001CB7359D|nr:hypothetical protein [Mycobacterium simiae]
MGGARRQGDAFKPTANDLDRALAGFLFLRDEPGTAKADPRAHGSGFDRVNSFRTGFDSGTGACTDYREGDPVVTEIPFNNEADLASGGNAPYDDMVTYVPQDLEEYWSLVHPQLTDQPWQPLQPVRPFDPARQPTCGGQSTTGYSLFYCVPEDYVGFETGAYPRFRNTASAAASSRSRPVVLPTRLTDPDFPHRHALICGR